MSKIKQVFVLVLILTANIVIANIGRVECQASGRTQQINVMSFTTPVAFHYGDMLNNIRVDSRADIIEYKYRLAHRRLQYRRWNRTRAYWVDPYWINA